MRLSKFAGTFARVMFLLVIALLIGPRARAQFNLLVYNTNNGGSGSLRQAISDNNALGGSGTIVFSNVVTGTITLTSGELLVTKNVTILGPGANVLAVNGNGTSRILHVTNAIATISGLTITNGHTAGSFPASSGGGIYSDVSILTVSNCTISGNSAGSSGGGGFGGGIYNYGESSNASLMVIASTFSGNSAEAEGGGIYSDGEAGHATLTVIASTFNSNSVVASGGGGIYNDGSSGSAILKVTASTFNSNSAPVGGGIYNDGFGGSATISVTNSTFSGNSGFNGGGIFNGGGNSGSATLKVLASTFSSNSSPGGNGGGIYIYGEGGSATLEIGDTIVNAGGVFGESIFNDAGTVTSDGYNLSSDNGGGVLTGLADQTGIDPMLGPLRDNGGPTWTVALRAGSTATDAGKSFGLTADQRGAPRPYVNPNSVLPLGGDGSDIGAFELGRPKLNLQKLNTNAVLTWQSYYGGFTLQSVTNVMASNSWATVAGTPAVAGNQYVVTNGPISSNRFYRLKGN